MPILPFRLRLPHKSHFLHAGILPYTLVPTSSSIPSSPRCPICRITFTTTPHTLHLRRCGHAVCTLCLILWLDYFNTCPVCDKRVYRGGVESWSFVEELRGVFAEDQEDDGNGDGESSRGREEEEEEGLGDKLDFWRRGVVVSQYTNLWKGEVDCVICLEGLLSRQKKVVIRSCNHAFHHVCLSRWLEEQNTCPICRTILFRKEKERMKTMWEELDENAYFVPQLGDVRDSGWRGGVLERSVCERVRVMGEPNEAAFIGDTESRK
jgi:hypothetical protein